MVDLEPTQGTLSMRPEHAPDEMPGHQFYLVHPFGRWESHTDKENNLNYIHINLRIKSGNYLLELSGLEDSEWSEPCP